MTAAPALPARATALAGTVAILVMLACATARADRAPCRSHTGAGAGAPPTRGELAGPSPGATADSSRAVPLPERVASTTAVLDARPVSPASRPRPALIGRRDAWFALGALVGVGAAAAVDEEALTSNGTGSGHLASAARQFGNVLVLAPATAIAYAAGLGLDRPGLASTSRHVGEALLATGVIVGALKLSVGRARPFQSGGEAFEFRPFSHYDSFPSGHTAFAFATAVVIDRETSSRWVPWVAYPVAGAVGWSRVRDGKHWTSDVIAGAALGAWVGGKVAARHGSGAASAARLRPFFSPAHGLLAGAEVRF